jgi:hypothetical protein
MIETNGKQRTPMDLIQEDFPSTPSNVFGHAARLLAANAGDGRFNDTEDILKKRKLIHKHF